MRFKLFGALFVLGWTIVIGISLWLNLDHQKEENSFVLRNVARNVAIQGSMYREWNASLGGVYAPVSELVSPNPFIKNVSKRDIPMQNGEMLTLINPPTMFSQISSLAEYKGHYTARLVSQDPFQPELIPDEWEKSALARLQEGAEEFGSPGDLKGSKHFRYMLPLFAEKGCLLSRGDDGKYKIGDLIAAISVSVPVKEFDAYIKRHVALLWRVHAIIWLLGIVGLVLSFRRIGREFNARLGAEREQRDMMEERNLLLNAAGEGVFGVDTKGRHTFVNPAAAQMLGYEVEDMIDKNSHVLCHHTKRDGTVYPEEECPIYGAFIDGKTHQGDDEIFWHKDGTSFPVSYTSRPMIKDGEIVGAVVTFNDISRKVEAEKEQKQLQEQLIQAQKMEIVGRLAGGVAHDFNNLLTVIIGYTWFALEKVKEDPELTKELGAVMKAGESAVGLTRQLLAFSRKQIMELQPVDMGRLVAGMAKMIDRLVEEDITIEIQKPSDPLPNVWGDPGQIEQVLMNLVVNARDAMPGGGSIVVRVMDFAMDDLFCAANKGAKPGHYVKISVADTGVGIPAEMQQKIFEPFFTTKGREKGTGLGLSTVYGIVKQLNGYVTLDSKVGEGSVFSVYLPVTIDEELNNGEEGGLVISENEAILLVEDDTAVAEMIKKQLESLDYKVLNAPSAELAIEVIASSDYSVDLLLTDIVLPGINGHELAEKITVSHPQIKVLFMSGYTDDVISEHGIQLSGIHFIHKPFTVKELSRKLRKVLES